MVTSINTTRRNPLASLSSKLVDFLFESCSKDEVVDMSVKGESISSMSLT